jgi:hypothetical protein
VYVTAGALAGPVYVHKCLIQYGDVGAFRDVVSEERPRIVDGVGAVVELIAIIGVCAQIAKILLDDFVSVSAVASAL